MYTCREGEVCISLIVTIILPSNTSAASSGYQQHITLVIWKALVLSHSTANTYLLKTQPQIARVQAALDASPHP
jgi:hypothetical protein